MEPADLFTQDVLFTDQDGLVDLVVLPTRWGAIAVDAAWYDANVIRNAEWRVPWKALLERAERQATLSRVVLVSHPDIEPFD